MSENSYPSKRKTKASLIRRARASKVVKMEIDPTSPSNITDQKLNTSMHDADDVLYMINDDYVGDYSDDDLITDESAEIQDDESEENDAYEAGGDD